MRARNRQTTQSAWNVVLSCALLATVMLVGTQQLAAQRPASTEHPELGVLPGQTDFTGSWRLMNRGESFTLNGVRGLDEARACGELQNALGGPAIRCSVPFDKLKSILHPRTFAFLEFVDEHLSTKYYCMAPTVPVLLDMGTWTFNPVSGGRLQLENLQWTGPVVRDVWMDGRTHPPPIEAFYQGHAVGWYENGELVVETANFTFDVDGLDDHNHIPSSQMKKVTERYTKISPDKLRVTITHEDPLFLREPFTWSQELTKVPRPEVGKEICNRESAIRELKLVAPDKYEGK